MPVNHLDLEFPLHFQSINYMSAAMRAKYSDIFGFNISAPLERVTKKKKISHKMFNYNHHNAMTMR